MRAVRAVVQGVGELCITLGFVLLLFVVWQLWWTDVAASQVQRDTVHRLERTWGDPAGPVVPHPEATTQAVSRPEATAEPVRLETIPMGKAFALIRVPRFGKDYVRPVIEGIELDVLDEGVGHYPDSADPGAVGNFAVAGHRVTYAKPFNQIAELRAGDPIVIETSDTWYVYRVQRHTIVTPDRVDVVAPVPEKPGTEPTQRLMTMTACHPMFSARERYVVFSKLDKTIAKTSVTVPDVLR